MADLTFTNLQAVDGVTADTFVVSTNKVMIDVSLLIGETVDQLTDAKVSESLYKLLLICKKAQDAYNAGLTEGNPNMVTFSSASNGVATTVNNVLQSNSSIGMTVRVKYAENDFEAITV